MNYKKIIQRLVETSQEKLTPWELDFISSVYSNYVLNGYDLSDRQKEFVIRINSKSLGREYRE